MRMLLFCSPASYLQFPHMDKHRVSKCEYHSDTDLHIYCNTDFDGNQAQRAELDSVKSRAESPTKALALLG